jgi:hypothetical protein
MHLSTAYHSVIAQRIVSACALLALMFCLAMNIQAQQPDARTTGTTYVLAFPDTVINTFDARYPNRMEDKVLVYIYSAVDNNRITVAGNGFNRVLTAHGGRFTLLDLTDPTFKAPKPIVTEVGKVSKNTFRVEAQQPVVVYCYMVTKYGCAAFTPIPIEFWGKEYYAQGLPGEPINDVAPAGEFNYYAKRKMAPAEIVVIAAEDNTLVTFVPSANSRLFDNPQINNVRLNKNEAYQIQSWVDTSNQANPAEQADISGVYITSTKPVGVLSGNTRAMVSDDVPGLAKNSMRDMTMEWVAPVDQHGHDFVYMPTMDSRRPKGTPGEDVKEKRSAEIVRLYATNLRQKPTELYETDPVNGTRTYYTIDRPGGFYHDRISVPEARFFNTDSVAQAFMTTTAVVKFLGTTGWGGGYIGAKYDCWGAYSVELVPREQWISSVPYFAPIHPSNMEHFINVVTDTASARKIYVGNAGGAPTTPFPFTKRIVGTDLIWGTSSVNTGVDLFITGWNAATGKPDTSVRFYGFVYGLYKGHEEYRPGRTGKKDEGGSGIASGGKGNEVLHPSEYEEYLAVTYGYPLAPSRVPLRSSDDLSIDTVQHCYTLTINVNAQNDNPVGLRSVRLDSIDNAKLKYMDPASPSEIIGKSAARFDVVAIDPLKNASAVVVITDRTNKTWRIPYSYIAESLEIIPDDPALIDFGMVQAHQSSTIQEIVLTNTRSRDMNVRQLLWANGTSGFEIVTLPALPLVLKPGDEVRLPVRITPPIDNRLFADTLRIVMNCIELKVKVQAETVIAILSYNDLNFGFLRLTESDTLQLHICNVGQGVISFNNPSGGDVITGLGSRFRISPADMQRLKDSVLGPGVCITIPVVFTGSDQSGVYSAQAIIWSSIGSDTVNLRAIVTDTPLGVETFAEGGTALTGIDPNPLHGTTRIAFALGTAGHATLEIFDMNGRRIALLVDADMQAGAHAAFWDASELPAGTYYCRLTAGEWNSTQSIVVR